MQTIKVYLFYGAHLKKNNAYVHLLTSVNNRPVYCFKFGLAAILQYKRKTKQKCNVLTFLCHFQLRKVSLPETNSCSLKQFDLKG